MLICADQSNLGLIAREARVCVCECVCRGRFLKSDNIFFPSKNVSFEIVTLEEILIIWSLFKVSCDVSD